MAVDAKRRRVVEQLNGSDDIISQSHPRDGTSPGYPPNFTDPRVCRPFLVGYCPYDTFENTPIVKAPCPNIHDQRLRENYRGYPGDWKAQYELEYEQLLKQYVDACDRRIMFSRVRIQSICNDPAERNLLKEIGDISMKITLLLDDINVLATRTPMAMALQQIPELEELRQIKKEKERELQKIHDTKKPETKFYACDVCGAYLPADDKEKPVPQHVLGKLHMGFQSIRSELSSIAVLKNNPIRPTGMSSRSREYRDDSHDEMYDPFDQRGEPEMRGRGVKDSEKDRHDGAGKGKPRGKPFPNKVWRAGN